MGLFSKIFNSKNKEDDFFKTILLNAYRMENSPNYQISGHILKDVFFSNRFTPDSFINNTKQAQRLTFIAINRCMKNGVKVPTTYLKLPIKYISNASKTKYGYIVEFPDAKYECECNFTAMMIENGQKRYYTSEFYSTDNKFMLCILNSDGNRKSGICNTTSYEQFKNAVFSN